MSDVPVVEESKPVEVVETPAVSAVDEHPKTEETPAVVSLIHQVVFSSILNSFYRLKHLLLLSKRLLLLLLKTLMLPKKRRTRPHPFVKFF